MSKMKFDCKGCERPHKTRSQMEAHERRCPRLKMSPTDSFFKILGNQQVQAKECIIASEDKILPLSQPLIPPVNISQPVNLHENISKPSSCTNELHSKPTGGEDTIDFGISSVSLSANAGHSRTTGSGTLQPKKNQKCRKRTLSSAAQPEVPEPTNHDENCPICREDVVQGQQGLLCELCWTWSHCRCLFITDEEYRTLEKSQKSWFCVTCQSIKANNIKWGNMVGEMTIKAKITATYEEIITTWRKNLFLLPRGKVGTEFIKELTRLIKLFTAPSKWNRIALSQLHIFIPLMLQKPSAKSKAKDHVKYLDKRLKLWEAGNLDAILSENREIQKKLKKSQKKTSEKKEKAFTRLMLLGKVSQAMKFVNNEDSTRGVHNITDEIKTLLQEKHPKSKEASNDILIAKSSPDPEPVIFEEIDGIAVHKAAKQIQGSGGPTLIDADGWKHILCSKSYGNASSDLCDAIADLAKKLCTEPILPETLHEFIANRLIPLDKGEDKEGNPGVRPIGVGEILRRIVGKVVVGCIREDIINAAAGPLQTGAGLKSGIEASTQLLQSMISCQVGLNSTSKRPQK